MSIKGILFDFNGTLFFDSHLHAEAFKRTFKAHGLPVPTTDFIASNIFGMQNQHIYRKFYDPNATEQDIEDFIEEKEGLYMDFFLEKNDNRLCDGAYDMLDYLKAHDIPYAIATGSEYKSVLFYIEHLGLDRWFTLDNIIYTNGTFRGKPYPDIYLLASERLGLRPEECAVFEDGCAGLKSAAEAGIGKRFAIYEKGIPSPLKNGITADGEYHDLTNWRNILKDIGLLK